MTLADIPSALGFFSPKDNHGHLGSIFGLTVCSLLHSSMHIFFDLVGNGAVDEFLLCGGSNRTNGHCLVHEDPYNATGNEGVQSQIHATISKASSFFSSQTVA